MIQLPLTTLSQETRWAYSTTALSTTRAANLREKNLRVTHKNIMKFIQWTVRKLSACILFLGIMQPHRDRVQSVWPEKKINSWKSRGERAPVPHSWRRQWRQPQHHNSHNCLLTEFSCISTQQHKNTTNYNITDPLWYVHCTQINWHCGNGDSWNMVMPKIH